MALIDKYWSYKEKKFRSVALERKLESLEKKIDN